MTEDRPLITPEVLELAALAFAWFIAMALVLAVAALAVYGMNPTGTP